MALLNKIFKRKSTKSSEERISEGKEIRLAKSVKPENKIIPPVRVRPKASVIIRPEDYLVLLGPHITEKAGDLEAKGKYVFKVSPRANKVQVKRAVSSIYNAKVRSVRILNAPSKVVRLGRTLGEKSGYKKAVVTLAQGQSIELK